MYLNFYIQNNVTKTTECSKFQVDIGLVGYCYQNCDSNHHTSYLATTKSIKFLFSDIIT